MCEEDLRKGCSQRLKPQPGVLDPEPVSSRDGSLRRNPFPSVISSPRPSHTPSPLARDGGFRGVCPATVSNRDDVIMHARNGFRAGQRRTNPAVVRNR